eukprot:1189036-Prorocentrum_minimum.AAC.2
MPMRRLPDVWEIVAQGEVEALKIYIKDGKSPNRHDRNNDTPLHLAAEGGNPSIVYRLINARAPLDVIGFALSSCCATWVSVGICAIGCTIGSQARLCVDGCEKRTPLHNAVKEGHSKVVKLLLDCDANPDLLDKNRNTALHLAATKGLADIVEKLLAKDAFIGLKNKEGYTARDCALANRHMGMYVLPNPTFRVRHFCFPITLAEIVQTLWGVECTLADIGTGGPVKRSHIAQTLHISRSGLRLIVQRQPSPLLDEKENKKLERELWREEQRKEEAERRRVQASEREQTLRRERDKLTAQRGVLLLVLLGDLSPYPPCLGKSAEEPPEPTPLLRRLYQSYASLLTSVPICTNTGP